MKDVGHGIRVAGKKRRMWEGEDGTREFFVSWLLGRRIEVRCQPWRRVGPFGLAPRRVFVGKTRVVANLW